MTDASMRFLIGHCPLGLSQHSASGKFIAASPACERLFGRSQNELIGQELMGLISGEAPRLLADEWSCVLATQSERQLRFTLVRPDGTSIWMEATLLPVAVAPTVAQTESEGEPTRQVLLCTRDVTAEVAKDRASAERLAQAEQGERHRDYLARMTPGLIWFGPVSPDLTSYRAVYISEYLFRVTGYSAKQWLETPGFWQSIIHADDREHILASAPAAMREGLPIGPYRIYASDGRILWLQSQMALERDAAGVPVQMYGLTLDMTSFQQAQHDRMVMQQELAEQAQRMLEVSTPLIPISDDVLVMPVIGTLDPTRAQHALETLLTSVSALRVRYVLVDLTGVSIVDAAGASALMKMTSAVRLLGSRVILTGLQPEIAQALIQLHLDLTEVVTRPSLRAAIAEFVTPRPADVRRTR